MPHRDINLLGILVAGIAPMIIGMLWYSPVMFARKWMALIGKSEEEIRKGGVAKAYVVSFIASLVMAYALDYFMFYAGAWSVMKGIKLGIALWIGFVATTSLAPVVYEGRPLGLYLINAGYNLVCLVIMGAIIGGLMLDPTVSSVQ